MKSLPPFRKLSDAKRGLANYEEIFEQRVEFVGTNGTPSRRRLSGFVRTGERFMVGLVGFEPTRNQL